MQQILVYGDSLSWGIVPLTRRRLDFQQRWPIVMETLLNQSGKPVRVIEDCLNGRRTVWEDPFRPGRNGAEGLAQRIEAQSPLALVMIMLGSNDFQSMHVSTAWHAAQGVAALVEIIRRAQIEPDMPTPGVLVITPPTIGVPKGDMAPKFAGAAEKSAGLAEAYAAVCAQLDCYCFNAGSVMTASAEDGVHPDASAHVRLGHALADVVATRL